MSIIHVERIKIWFENCIVLELPVEEFESINIENVGVRYRKCNSSCDMEELYWAYGGARFSLKPDVSRGRFLWMNKMEDPDLPCNHETIVQSLSGQSYHTTYMVSIVLCYDDGSEKEIYVPFKPTTIDGVENALQSMRFDKQGRLVVEIRPDDSDAIEDGDNEDAE